MTVARDEEVAVKSTLMQRRARLGVPVVACWRPRRWLASRRLRQTRSGIAAPPAPAASRRSSKCRAGWSCPSTASPPIRKTSSPSATRNRRRKPRPWTPHSATSSGCWRLPSRSREPEDLAWAYRTLGQIYAYQGEMASSGEAFDKAYETIAPLVPANPALREATHPLDLSIAVANLRRGELENCLTDHNAERCIFPISRRGVHQHQSGSRAPSSFSPRRWRRTRRTSRRAGC